MSSPDAGGTATGAAASLVRDEVCGMEFPLAEARAVAELNGRTYYFCTERCRQHFLAHAGWYVAVTPNAETTSGGA